MKFSMFFMAEYIAMITMSALVVTLYLGGYHPGFPTGSLEGWALWGLQIGAFLAKVGFLMFLYVWVRWTLPRIRVDQVMNLCYKYLTPIAFICLLGTCWWES